MSVQRWIRNVSLSLALAAGWCTGTALGQPAGPAPDRLLQHELKQQQIRGVTEKINEQMGAIVAEFERNGLGGDDVTVLKSIQAIIGRLTTGEMERVVTLLQTARQTREPLATRQRVVDAYSHQKNIVVQLRQLLLQHQRQHALHQLSVRFNELANRQNANLRESVVLARALQQKPALDELQKISLQLQETEQLALGEEVKLTLTRLQGLTTDTDGSVAQKAVQAADHARSNDLLNELGRGLAELKAGKLMSASGSEKNARDILRKLGRLLAPAVDEQDALRLALREVEQAIAQQTQVLDQTRKLEGRKGDAAQLESRQADLVDRTEVIRDDLVHLSPTATEQLKLAEDKMQEAREILGSNQFDSAAKRSQAPATQRDALARLDQAHRLLEDQLARAEEKPTITPDALSNLRQIQNELRELIPRQSTLKEETAAAARNELARHAPHQGDLSDKSRELQQRAAPDAASAAQSLAEAASQMEKTQKHLVQNENLPAAQQAALDALNQADRQLSEEIAKLEQAAKELAALEELLKQLIALIEEQQLLRLETALAADPIASARAPVMAREQERIGVATTNLQQTATPPAPAAAGHLGQAGSAMSAARGELDRSAARGAHTRQVAALNEMYLAKRLLEQQIQALRDLLGQPPDALAAMADAAAAIEEAQRDVSEAIGQLPMEAKETLAALQEQQEKIAKELGQLGDKSAGAKRAHSPASQASAQLGQRKLASAINAMQETQDALKAAAAAGDDAGGAMSDLAQQQAEVQKMAELLTSGGTRKAAQSLKRATQRIGPATSGRMGMLPGNVQSNLEQAEQALVDATSNAEGDNAPGASQSAQSAQQSLAQALAALSMAQAGMQGKNPGQGQGPEGEGQGPGQPGQGQGQGQSPGNGKGQGRGEIGNWSGAGGADGSRRSARGSSEFIGLPARERAAIEQSRSEKYPQEYGTLVEQYLKNLADETGEE